MSPRSFAATISMPRSPSAALAARQKLRPMRPKPLIPTRIVTVLNLLVDPLIASAPRLSDAASKDGPEAAPGLRARSLSGPLYRAGMHRLLRSRPYQRKNYFSERARVRAAANDRSSGGRVDPRREDSC